MSSIILGADSYRQKVSLDHYREYDRNFLYFRTSTKIGWNLVTCAEQQRVLPYQHPLFLFQS